MFHNTGLADMYPFVRNAAVEAELTAGVTAAVAAETAPVAPVTVMSIGDLAARSAALSERIAADKAWIDRTRPTDMSHDLSLVFGLTTASDVARQRAYAQQHRLAD